MSRRTPIALLVLLLVCVTTACGPNACTKKGGSSTIKLQVPPAIQKLSKTFRIELCQGKRCEAVNFASKPAQDDGTVSKGITLEGDAYTIDVDLLGKRWKADSPTGLTVLGLTKKGRTVLRHTEQFAFDGYYPNGKDCDKDPYVQHGTSVGGDDLVD